MTNEAVLIYELESAIPFEVDNATGIEKGAILKLSGSQPLNAALCNGTTADLVAGIAASEKIALDGNKEIGVFRRGIFRVLASGTISMGDPIGTYGVGATNYVYSLRNGGTNAMSGSRILGYALEPATDEQTFYMEENIQYLPGAAVS